MSVWVCVPSARPVEQVLVWMGHWKAHGYKVALWRDDSQPLPGCDLTIGGTYPGYAVATNALVKEALLRDQACDWTVGGGDDVTCDNSHTADEIAAQCSAYFGQEDIVSRYAIGAIVCGKQAMQVLERVSTFGVMQATGDRWGDDAYGRAKWPEAPAMIDRICGSPWMGRSFCERVNQGNGPFWGEYHHNWCDQEMLEVCRKLGILWQRRDLTHYHNHSRRNGGDWLDFQKGFDADYRRMQPLFRARQAAGFPGSAPL